ncbi:dioxygenase [Chitiniphilus purpureus]|uniref:Dioxygenase n=1 Tax=Chitiniphilus purpureus TaxID=2981137 RepID=A0ABY6DKT0_9NEIS|nr:class III extradiol ring-cleavage dioxygenase [Chitiniphilus sp. CD1]UXY14971.1 dioxygenase [Chitiniphilus sp. CD1]
MSRLPTLFISHGSPMLALDAGAVGRSWDELARSLPQVRAVLIASAHWHVPGSAVTAHPSPETIHDFRGFPPALYALRYPAPGDPALAEQVLQLLRQHGFAAHSDPVRGLDHGAWVPLQVMYPQADVPVVQLALDMRQGPAWHETLGQALAALRDEQVLIIGSGSLTHNLQDVFNPMDEPLDYVAPFQAWMHDHLVRGERQALLDYRRHAPQAARAHPTEEHLLPLFVALGAAHGDPARRLYDKVSDRALAMDLYRFG